MTLRFGDNPHNDQASRSREAGVERPISTAFSELYLTNPIIATIGRLDDPFSPRDVTTKFSIIPLLLLQERRGKGSAEALVNHIAEYHVSGQGKQTEFRDLIWNEHMWINGLIDHLMWEYANGVLAIDDFYRTIGRRIVNSGFLYASAGQAFGINFLYRSVARLNHNFNSICDLQFDAERSSLGYTVIRRRLFSGHRERLQGILGDELEQRASRYSDELFQGALEAIPRGVRSDIPFAKVVDEPKCEFRGDHYCEYHIEWAPEGLGRAFVAMKQALRGLVKRGAG